MPCEQFAKEKTGGVLFARMSWQWQNSICFVCSCPSGLQRRVTPAFADSSRIYHPPHNASQRNAARVGHRWPRSFVSLCGTLWNFVVTRCSSTSPRFIFKHWQPSVARSCFLNQVPCLEYTKKWFCRNKFWVSSAAFVLHSERELSRINGKLVSVLQKVHK